MMFDSVPIGHWILDIAERLIRNDHESCLSTKDYRAMKVILFYGVLEFDSILEKLADLESELNSK
ncbi:MAG: hypothetical protein K8S62_13045 [Candidatus Sabulitectum sp.]|nr:hypothetical protein [Candidatus Sabulitectum sp.]